MRIRSVVERRLLVNYRVDAEYAARQLPPQFRPQLVNGHAVAGICLLRLGQARPAALPGKGWGLSSENAAHRYAVEWDSPHGPTTGVYITRRHSSSRLNVVAGGRVFPGIHGRAAFDVTETDTDVSVRFATADGAIKVDVAGTVQPDDWWRGSELFESVAAATAFFRNGCDGYSPARGGGYEGMRMCCESWQLRPVAMSRALSSVYAAYPAGAATLGLRAGHAERTGAMGGAATAHRRLMRSRLREPPPGAGSGIGSRDCESARTRWRLGRCPVGPGAARRPARGR